MKVWMIAALTTLSLIAGCKKEEVEETDVEEIDTETGAVETDAPVDTDQAQ